MTDRKIAEEPVVTLDGPHDHPPHAAEPEALQAQIAAAKRIVKDREAVPRALAR